MDLTPALIRYLPFVIDAAAVAVCVLAVLRGVRTRLPYFWAYLIILMCADTMRWFTLIEYGKDSRSYTWVAWLTQMVLVLARGAVMADVCRAALGQYTGVWRLARLLLVSAATLMVAAAGVRTSGTSAFSYVLFFERELEVCILLSMIGLLLLSKYYGVSLNEPLRGITFGLAFYSIIVVITNTTISGPLQLPWEAYWDIFNIVRMMAFLGALGFWIHALWLPLPETAEANMLPPGEYEEGTVTIMSGIEKLNEYLKDLMKL